MRVPVPAGAVDCHAHILGPFDRYPLAASRAYTPDPALLDDYLARLDELGVTRAVIVQASVYASDNECTIDAVRRLGERGRGVAAVPADTSGAELQRLRDAGMAGLRLNHLQLGPATRDSVKPYVAMARAHGFHLQLFQQPQAWASVLPVLLDSGIDWVVDHLGMVPATAGVTSVEFRALRDAVAAGGWVKLSGFYRISALPGYSDVRPMVDALIDAAPERCLWGSDWPHTDTAPRPDTQRLLSLLSEWLTPADFKRVMVLNPARLYWS
jgi:2-pyrone-4,6-dicarboxylate lactonase